MGVDGLFNITLLKLIESAEGAHGDAVVVREHEIRRRRCHLFHLGGRRNRLELCGAECQNCFHGLVFAPL